MSRVSGDMYFIVLYNCCCCRRQDELLWGAGWLYTATNETYYLDLLKSVGGGDGVDIFSWDNKYAGAHVLLAKVRLINWLIG